MRHPPLHRATPAGSLRGVLSPRGALAFQRADDALPFALRAALVTALAALPPVLSGRPGDAVFAVLGSFTTTFGRGMPYARRARVLAAVAVAMTLCVAAGSALGAGLRPQDGGAGALLVVAAMALVAGAAKLACDRAGLGGLGAVMPLFAFAVAAHGAPTPAEVLPRTLLALGGATAAWLAALAGRLTHRDGPRRHAAATALHAVAALLDAEATGTDRAPARHRATAAVLEAYRTLGPSGPPEASSATPGTAGGPDRAQRLTDLCWELLVGAARRRPSHEDPARTARALRAHARALTRRRPGGGPPLPPPSSVRRPHGTPRLAPAPLVPALRMVLGTGLAGAVALGLGLGHGYWAAVSAAAVLHSVDVRTASRRAAQRTLGTAAGLVLAAAVLGLGPGPLALAGTAVVLELLLEYAVARNYGLGVVFLTPLALFLTELAAPAEQAGELVLDRALGSLLGVLLALLCALAVVHDRAAVRLHRALDACVLACAQAREALAAGRAAGAPVVLQARLAAAVVELREAEAAAAGELWPAGTAPAELARAERRAYRLLGLLASAGREAGTPPGPGPVPIPVPVPAPVPLPAAALRVPSALSPSARSRP
ncbi:FUSC family protein [Streptomyces sp. NPDC056503]|uniref:FUSC family protein n=1 Tax=Streptomyces sp. NPDC056503 TaxID=3345842 RepID=UPI0036887D70